MDLQDTKIAILKILGLDPAKTRAVKIEFDSESVISINADSALLEGVDYDVSTIASKQKEFMYGVRRADPG